MVIDPMAEFRSQEAEPSRCSLCGAPAMIWWGDEQGLGWCYAHEPDAGWTSADGPLGLFDGSTLAKRR